MNFINNWIGKDGHSGTWSMTFMRVKVQNFMLPVIYLMDFCQGLSIRINTLLEECVFLEKSHNYKLEDCG